MNLPAYRAAARIARRQAARARWRSALVLAAIALPIAALTTTAVCIRTAFPTRAERITEEFGTADLDVYPNARTTRATLERLLPRGSIVTSIATMNATRPIVTNASIVYFGVYEFGTPLERRPLAGIYRLLDGREPLRPGEAVASSSVLDPLGLHVGDTLSPRPGVDLTITGVVARTGHLHDPVVVIAPGTLAALGERSRPDTYMVDLPAAARIRAVLSALAEHRLSYTLPAEQMQGQEHLVALGTAGAFGAAALLLLATGLIAGAAIAIGARRQLRTLGLLGAAGAERRHVRATVLATGVTLGAVGSGIGVALGIAAAFAIRPLLDGLAGRYVGRLEVPASPLLGAFVLGLAASTIAALLPARTAAQIPTLDALADRSPPPRRPGRLAAAGAVVAVVGGIVTGRGIASHDDPLSVVGVVAMVLGILCGIPSLVGLTGRLAGVLPALPRIAARDISRHGRRTGAALAACALAVAVPVLIAAQTLSDQVRMERGLGLGADQLSIYSAVSGRGPSGLPAALAALRAAFPGSTTATLVPATITEPRHGRERVLEVSAFHRDPDGWSGTSLYVGGADVLRALDAEDAIPALERGDVVGVGLDEPATVELGIFTGGVRGVEIVERSIAVASAGGASPAAVRYLISPSRAAELGMAPSLRPSESAIFRAAHALTSDDLARARAIVSSEPDLYLSSRLDASAGSAEFRAVVTAAGSGVALVIVGVIVALLSAEARRDRAILVAIGAGPRARRAVAGASAALVGLLSALVGAVIGLSTSFVFLRSGRGGPFVVPWWSLGSVLVVVPLLAGVLSALVSRQPRAAQLLRPVA
jgi:putative ABC transport system permease protein